MEIRDLRRYLNPVYFFRGGKVRLTRAGILKDKMPIAEIHGSRMFLNVLEPGIASVLYVFRTREELEVEVVKSELREGMTVLDVGANIGYYALLESRLVGRTGKVYAIEPFPRNLQILEQSIALNGYENIVEVFHCAASNIAGRSKLFLGKAANLHTLTDALHTNEHIEVDTVRLDDFVKGRREPDFVRMDIEGFESKVLDGFGDYLSTTTKKVKIFFEVHPFAYSNGEMVSVLDKLEKWSYYPKYVISAAVPVPAEFRKRGYVSPKKILENRGLYEGISMQDVKEMITMMPKVIRDVLLEKR